MTRIHYKTNSVITPADRNLARKASVVLGVPLAMLLSSMLIVPTAHADTKKPTISAPDAKQAALLLEIRKNLTQTGKFNKRLIDNIMGELQNKSMADIRDMANFVGRNVPGAESLVGPGAKESARDHLGRVLGSSGSGSSATGNGTQSSVQSQLTGGGINDTRGHDSVKKESCDACPGKNGKNPGNVTEDKSTETKSNGDVVTTYPDSSKSIVRGGKTEYVNSHGRVVDKAGNGGFWSWLLSTTTPLPDDNNPSSGRLTFADQKRLGLIGTLASEPDPNSGSGTGGGIDGTKSNRTGTVGLFTEAGTLTYTSKAEIQEVIRLSIEKLQGPKVGK